MLKAENKCMFIVKFTENNWLFCSHLLRLNICITGMYGSRALHVGPPCLYSNPNCCTFFFLLYSNIIAAVKNRWQYDFRKQESSSKLCAVCFIARWCHQTWTDWAFKVYLECEILLACLFTICPKLLQKKRLVLLWEAMPVWSKGRMCTPCPVYLRHCKLYGFNFCDWQMQKQIEATRYHDIKACATASETLFNNAGTWGIGAWFRGSMKPPRNFEGALESLWSKTKLPKGKKQAKDYLLDI